MNRSKRLLLCAIALTLVLAACGSSSKSGSKSNSITLAVNPWEGSEANATVAKLILEKQGIATVNLKTIDENAAWPALDSDSIDGNLEVWPSGHAQDFKTFVDTKKSVVNVGLLGPIGHIGWYIPKFVADAHPEYTKWEGLKSAAAAKYFATAETGNKGQFILGDPSYVSFDAGIIKNLDLPFQVVNGGSEAALITSIGTAFKDKTPLLFYFYKPQWANNKYDLVSVKLPPVTPACTAAAASGDKSHKYACDYPTDHLTKVVSAKLEAKNAKAFNFLKKMNWTAEDQNAVVTYVHKDNLKMPAAAQKWVDDNPTVWKAWLS